MNVQCFLSPPQDMEADKVCEWMPLAGWIASSLPFTDVRLISKHASDNPSISLMEDTGRLPPEFASKFLRRFKSKISVREMLGDEENGLIIMKVIYDYDKYDLVEINMPRYKFRKEKADKVNQFAAILACPYCRQSLNSDSGELQCRECGKHFTNTGNSFNFLTDDFQKEFSIVPTDNVSSNNMSGVFLKIVQANPDKIFLDLGAGFKTNIFPNLINFEIADYPSTDILGVGEKLPFLSASLDGVYCDCVLEHVKDPFACAQEIMRVLKPGGYMHCTVPFLQPVHAYPNHFYNMTLQGLINLFQGMEVRETSVPDYLHPMVSIIWILKSYLVWLPDKEKQELASMTVLDLLQTFPMGSFNTDHPIWKSLPKEKLSEIASGNILIAIKQGAACYLKGALET